MNNEKIVEGYNEFGDENLIDKVPFQEKHLGDLKEIIESLNGIQKNEHYIKLKKLYLTPRLDSFTRQVRSEAEPIKLYRLQGRLIELENLIRLDLIVQQLDNEFKTLKQQIDEIKGRKINE